MPDEPPPPLPATVTPELPPPRITPIPAAPAASLAPLTTTLRCSDCDAPLATLSLDARCGACGLPVITSYDRFRSADPIRRARQALRTPLHVHSLAAVAYLLILSYRLVMFFADAPSVGPRPPIYLIGVDSVIVVALMLAGSAFLLRWEGLGQRLRAALMATAGLLGALIACIVILGLMQASVSHDVLPERLALATLLLAGIHAALLARAYLLAKRDVLAKSSGPWTHRLFIFGALSAGLVFPICVLLLATPLGPRLLPAPFADGLSVAFPVAAILWLLIAFADLRRMVEGLGPTNLPLSIARPSHAPAFANLPPRAVMALQLRGLPIPTIAAPVTIKTPCARCGYELKGLDAGGACPECNLPVAESTWLGPAERMLLKHQHTIRRAAIFHLAALASVPVVAAASYALTANASGLKGGGEIFGLPLVVCATAAGSWLLSLTEPAARWHALALQISGTLAAVISIAYATDTAISPALAVGLTSVSGWLLCASAAAFAFNVAVATSVYHAVGVSCAAVGRRNFTSGFSVATWVLALAVIIAPAGMAFVLGRLLFSLAFCFVPVFLLLWYIGAITMLWQRLDALRRVALSFANPSAFI
ncbi:hypothetical protein BH11PLA1_BH11PLA1_07510 [soil metagenome]